MGSPEKTVRTITHLGASVTSEMDPREGMAADHRRMRAGSITRSSARMLSTQGRASAPRARKCTLPGPLPGRRTLARSKGGTQEAPSLSPPSGKPQKCYSPTENPAKGRQVNPPRILPPNLSTSPSHTDRRRKRIFNNTFSK